MRIFKGNIASTKAGDLFLVLDTPGKRERIRAYGSPARREEWLMHRDIWKVVYRLRRIRRYENRGGQTMIVWSVTPPNGTCAVGKAGLFELPEIEDSEQALREAFDCWKMRRYLS